MKFFLLNWSTKWKFVGLVVSDFLLRKIRKVLIVSYLQRFVQISSLVCSLWTVEQPPMYWYENYFCARDIPASSHWVSSDGITSSLKAVLEVLERAIHLFCWFFFFFGPSNCLLWIKPDSLHRCVRAQDYIWEVWKFCLTSVLWNGNKCSSPC